MAMKVFVTGAGGHIGNRLIETLLAQGHTVTGCFHGRPAGEPHPDLRVVVGDLRNSAELLREPYDLVVHAAGRSPGPGVGIGDYVDDNIAASRSLFAAAAGCGLVVFLSGISVYGRVTAATVDETTPICDPDAYGLSKRVCERLLEECAGRPPAIVLRLPGVLGPGARTPWAARVLERMRAGEAVEAFAPEAPFNNAVDIDDLAGFIVGLPDRIRSPFDLLTLSAAGSLSIREVLALLAEGADRPADIRFQSAERQPFMVSHEKARKDYGYTPSHIRDILREFARTAGGDPIHH
jgi:nucleoside-diphosphate-sugar epimerase